MRVLLGLRAIKGTSIESGFQLMRYLSKFRENDHAQPRRVYRNFVNLVRRTKVLRRDYKVKREVEFFFAKNPLLEGEDKN